MSKEDGLPESACAFCISKVREMYDFKIQIENVDSVLRELASTKEDVKLDSEVFQGDIFTEVKIENSLDLMPDSCEENKESMLESTDNFDSLRNTDCVREQDELLSGNYFIENIIDKKSSIDGDDDQSNVKHTYATIGIKTISKCSLCKKSFKIKSNLKKHLEKCRWRRKGEGVRSTEDLTEAGAETDGANMLDNKLLSTEGLLTKQEKSKATEGLFICEQCGGSFRSRFILKQHSRTHNPIKPFSCESCSKRFTRRAHLLTHIQIHKQIKRFVCESCGRGYTRKTDLLRHAVVHSERRAHACALCPRTFKRHGDVRTHMRVHTGEKPFSCDRCGNRFQSQSSIKKHKMSRSACRPDKPKLTNVENSNINPNYAARVSKQTLKLS